MESWFHPARRSRKGRLSPARTVLYIACASVVALAYYWWVRLVHARLVPAINSMLARMMTVARPRDASASSPSPSRRAGFRGCFLSLSDSLATSFLTMLPGAVAVLIIIIAALK